MGHTKKSRAEKGSLKRKKNDGRPPDTIKELLKPKPTKAPSKQPKSKKESLKSITPKDEPGPVEAETISDSKAESPVETETPTSLPSYPIPSYPWRNNSCWLDSSLQILYTASLKFPDDFNSIREALPENSALRAILESFLHRQELDVEDLKTSRLLSDQPDNIRRLLRQKKAIQSLSEYESLFVRSFLIHLNKWSDHLSGLVCRTTSP